MAAKNFLKELGTDIANTKLEFLPTSNSTKPMFIANGLFRACTGKKCNIEDVYEWIMGSKRADKEQITVEELKEKYVDILERKLDENNDDIKEFVFLLEKVLNPDTAVQNRYKESVMLISSYWFISDRKRGEAKIGDFIYDILAQPKNGRKSRAIELTQKALQNDKDDITRLIRNFLSLGITLLFHIHKGIIGCRQALDFLAFRYFLWYNTY